MDSRPYFFQSGHPLAVAVQLRLTPELKQALINARGSGEAVSLRFREEPHREAVLSIAGQEYFFSTAPQAGQVEVLEVAPKSKGAVSVASIKQRLTLQRALDTDARPRGLAGSLAGGLPDDRKKRSAVLLDSSQRGAGRGGMKPRVTTTTEVVTRAAPQPPPQPAHGAAGASGRLNNGGMAALAGGSMRPTPGSAPAGPRPGVTAADARKPMELPRPRSLHPGGGSPKPPPPKARKTPTPPPPETAGPDAAAAPGGGSAAVTAAAGAQQGTDSRPGSGGGGSGGGGGSPPVGYGGGGGAAAAAVGGSGGGGAAGPAPALAAPSELPRAAVMAARRGDLPLVLAALLREQPLTASSLQSRIDATYRAAGAKPEAREYVKRVIDNCCTMSANRMHLKPEVLTREGPRLDDLVSGTSPTAGDTASGAAGCAGGGGADRSRGPAGRHGQGQGAAVKRMASCSPDPRLSPDQDPSPGAGHGGRGRSTDEATASGATAVDDDEDGSHHHNSMGPSRGPRHGPAGGKRQKMGPSGGAGGAAVAGHQRQGQGQGFAAGRSGGSLQGYDDFDDLADLPVASAPARESSGGRPTGQQHVGRAAVAKANAVKRVVVASGGPRGLPSHSSAPAPTAAPPPPRQQPLQPQAPPSRPRPAAVDGAATAAAAAPPAATKAPPRPVAAVAAPTPSAVPAARTGSEDVACTGGAGGVSESQMDTDGRGTNPAASPECESALDPEIQAYADLDPQEDDKDAEWYRTYVDWKPEPHAAVQTNEQYEQYEREYRAKFEVYHRLNQKYNEMVREVESHRVAVDSARGAEERHRYVRTLWRLGAAKWKLLEVWKRARCNLHMDLGDLRTRVVEYVSRQEAPPPPAQQQHL